MIYFCIQDMQDPQAMIVLLQNDLVLIDLLKPGFPAFEIPHPLNLHEAAVTVCCYLADCPSDLVPAFYSAGKIVLHIWGENFWAYLAMIQ